MSTSAVAPRLAAAVEPIVGGELPVRLRAWDGSEAGRADAPLVELRSPDAVRRLLRNPGELGAAQTYVTGELEVHEVDGWDLDAALTGGGPFIESFIAPDMHMRPVGETVALLEGSGLEARDVHALREHYVLTVAGWLRRFESNVERLTELVGEEVVRVWRLYLVGGAMAFRDGRMGVDQVLLVRPGAAHTLPWSRAW
jgi:hypothetical protein